MGEEPIYIKEIELEGFKSFKNLTRIYLDKCLIGITGPNGAGKSNIVDSILFALGRYKRSRLRVVNIKELINFKSDRARVKIVFSNGVEIERIVTKKGYSYFKLNNKNVTLDELEAFISQFLPLNYPNVILQGRFEEILYSSPRDKLRLIKDVTGVHEFEERKKEFEEKLKEIKAKLDILEDEKKVKEKRLRNLEAEKEKLEKYRK